jgi:hypothetical protein
MVHRRSLLGLLLCLVFAVVGSSRDAAASDALFPELQAELLPIGAITGDGVTPVTLHALILEPDGTPTKGAAVKVSVTGGTVGLPEEVAPGLIRFAFTPPPVESTRQVELTLKLKTLDKRKVRRTWGLVCQPAVGQRLTLTTDPARIMAIVGPPEDPKATKKTTPKKSTEGGPEVSADFEPTVKLNVQLQGGALEWREGANLGFRASSGTIENVTDLGGGRWTALYLPGAVLAPHPAIITVVDLRDPTRTYGHAIVPITVSRELEVTVRPKTMAFIDVGEKGVDAAAGGERVYGPIEPDRRGKATVKVELPPGISQVRVRSVSETDEEVTELDLELEQPPLVAFMAHYERLPADPSVPTTVRLVAAQPDGTPDTQAALRLQTTLGSLSAPIHEGAGVYVATLTPADANSPAVATLTAAVGEGPGHGMNVDFVPRRPDAVVATFDPSDLGPEDATVNVSLRITGAAGEGLMGRTLTLTPTGARQEGELLDNGDGTYLATLRRTGRGPIELLATVQAAATRNDVRQLVALSTRQRLPPDGLSSSTITVLALDEFGYPVADVPLALSMIHGDGQLPKKADTGPNGVAQFFYTAGRAPGLVNIFIQTGNRAGNIGLMQLPPAAAPDLILPRSGTAAQIEQQSGWEAIVTTARAEKR